MVSNIGLKLESDEDNDEDSKKEETDWGLIFALFKNRGFSHQEILNLSYPQFSAYMKSINNPLAYSITIPYMGSGKEEEKQEFENEDTLLGMIASMNEGFM